MKKEPIIISQGKDKLDKSDLEEKISDALIVVYDYEAEIQGGLGVLIAFKEGKFYFHILSHCSCLGPMDEFTYDKPYEDLDSLREAASEDGCYAYDEEIDALIEIMKKEMEERL